MNMVKGIAAAAASAFVFVVTVQGLRYAAKQNWLPGMAKDFFLA